jgi:hypothetical protein
MFKDRTNQNQYIKDLNAEQDKKEQRVLTLKWQLSELTREQDKLLKDATADIVKYIEEMRKPILGELYELENPRPH